VSPGQAVRDVLVADPTVAGLVAGRVYPGLIPPRAAFPAIVFTVVSQVPEETFEGTAATALVDSRVQIDCYAKSYDDAQKLAEAVDDALTELDDQLLRVVRLDSRDLFDDELLLHRVSTDFSVWRGR
jgi:hypothetical protein